MSPLAGHRVIPDGWAGHHRPTTAGTMRSTVDLHRPGQAGGWDPTTGPQEATTAPYGEGVAARVQRLSTRDRNAEAAGQDLTTGAYLVAVPMSTPPARVGDVVTVTAAPADPELVGKRLLVAEITYGSAPFQRDLTCTLDLTRQDNQPGG